MKREVLYKEINALALGGIISNEYSSEKELNLASDKWLDNLPLIICGPILRKVDYNNVSVWMAFKEKVSDITLRIFESNTPNNYLFSGQINSPLKIGKNLFVTLVTATSSNVKLISDKIYGYKITLKHNGVIKILNDTSVLQGGINSIAYAPYAFPTFCLPSDNINNLKIVHGSCRKPHGGKTDALRALDTMIEINSTNSVERPQLLCLTGDQIYADDVADSLLHQIQQVSKKLMGWQENMPNEIKISKSGWRKDNILKAGFTTTDHKSHLIYFEEFIMMYLFCFSEVLWASEIIGFTDVIPDNKPKDIKQAEHIHNLRENFKKEAITLNSFKKCLPFVRKALANISTLMIFDDHEITDDWHIDKAWNEQVLQNPLGRRIILNGLSAYAIFQDWGNDFTKYQAGKGLEILKAFEKRTENSPKIHYSTFERILIPELKQDDKKESHFLQSNFTWHHKHIFNSFQLVFLNTRTERQYIAKEAPLGNLIKNLSSQFGQLRKDKLLVLVSPVPVLGNIPMEKGQEKLRTSILKSQKGMYPKDQEAWSFSDLGFSKLLSVINFYPKVLILSGDVHYGFTSYIRLWQKNGDSYRFSEIIQSTSSALKNSSNDLHDLTINGKVPQDIFGGKPIPMELVKVAPYKMLKVVGVKNFKDTPMTIIENPRFENLEDLIWENELLSKALRISPLIQFTVRYLTSQGYSLENILSKIENSEQAKKKVFKNLITPDRIQPVVVAKDNISLISFSENSIKNTIWLAKGAFEGSDDKEARGLMFPYVNHKIVFNNKFTSDEIPTNEFIKKVGKATKAISIT